MTNHILNQDALNADAKREEFNQLPVSGLRPSTFLLAALVLMATLLSPFANGLNFGVQMSLAQETTPDTENSDSPATETEEVEEEPAKLPVGPPSISPETFRMIETIEKKNRQLKRREEEIRLKEKHLKALGDAIREDLAKIEGALQRSREQIGIKDELIQENINALVKAYSTMKPDKAATLLEAVNQDLALQIISGMKSKVAGKVLSRLKVQVAKNISEKLAGQGKKKAGKK